MRVPFFEAWRTAFARRRAPAVTLAVPERLGLLLAGFAGAVATFAIVWVSQMPRSVVTEVPTPVADFVTYTSDAYGYSLRYPRGWTSRRVIAEGALEVVTLSGGTEAITVTVTDGPVATDTLIPGSPVTFTLRGAPATRYRDVDVKRGVAVERVVVSGEGGRSYVIEGSGSTFERVVQTFTFRAP